MSVQECVLNTETSPFTGETGKEEEHPPLPSFSMMLAVQVVGVRSLLGDFSLVSLGQVRKNWNEAGPVMRKAGKSTSEMVLSYTLLHKQLPQFAVLTLEFLHVCILSLLKKCFSSEC